MKKKLTLFVALLSAILAANAAALNAEDNAKLGERKEVKEGGFSYRPPANWKFAEFPGLKYPIASGPPAAGFAPNINVVDEAFAGTLADYAAASLKALETVFKDFKKISQTDVKLDSGESAMRIVTTSTQGNSQLRESFYVMVGPKSKGKTLVVTCSALAEKGEASDTNIERSIKTFEVEK